MPSAALPVLHHLSFSVRDLQRAAVFYDAVLAALGYVRVWTDATAVGYGRPGEGDCFAIKSSPHAGTPPGPGFHVAFSAPSTAAVDAFHRAALQANGADNGAPGWRPQYGAGYYAAFVFDPDGYPIEAVVITDR